MREDDKDRQGKELDNLHNEEKTPWEECHSTPLPFASSQQKHAGVAAPQDTLSTSAVHGLDR